MTVYMTYNYPISYYQVFLLLNHIHLLIHFFQRAFLDYFWLLKHFLLDL